MDIRTYRVSSMKEAMALIRRDLGPDAVILQTRETAARGLLGWLPRGKQLEVVASNEVDVPSRLPDPKSTRPAKTEHVAARSSAEAATRSPAKKTNRAANGQDEVLAQLGELRDRVEKLNRVSPASVRLAEPFQSLYEHLLAREFGDAPARALVERVANAVEDKHAATGESLHRELAAAVGEDLPPCVPFRAAGGKRTVAAFVGPTGVGKTTTVAKLAAQAVMRDRKSVGLVTLDVFRTAAIEQLQTYADLIDAPLCVAATPRELRESIQRFQDADLVLIDTAGCGPRDASRLDALRTLLQEAEIDEVHLVASASTCCSALRDAAVAFSSLGLTGCVLTKLDEVSGLGRIWEWLREHPLPIAGTAAGQNVPDDLEPADRHRLAERMVAAA